MKSNINDERIQATVNRCAATGFVIWYVLMSISLCYRVLILKQHVREWWDIFAILNIGTLYIFIAYANKGVFAHGFERRWRRWLLTGIVSFTGAIIGFVTMKFIMSRTLSVADLGVFLAGWLPGMGLFLGIAYFLSRRWKRKEGIEDEK